MLKKISAELGAKLGKRLLFEQDRIDILAYGLEILLGVLLKTTILMLFSYWLGIFNTTICCTMSFIIFRIFGGGVHLSTYCRCLVVGLTILLALGKFATINIDIDVLLILLWLVFSVGLFTIVKWVPAGTEKKQVTDKTKRIKLKKQVFGILIVWTSINYLMIQSQYVNYCFANILGSFTSFMLMTPIGYKGLHILETILNTKQRRNLNA